VIRAEISWAIIIYIFHIEIKTKMNACTSCPGEPRRSTLENILVNQLCAVMPVGKPDLGLHSTLINSATPAHHRYQLFFGCLTWSSSSIRMWPDVALDLPDRS
jgi:hypothetical protein